MVSEENIIKVSGVKLYYIEQWDTSEYGNAYWTEFYTKEGMKPERRWSWRKFRMISTGKMIPNYVERFVFDFWITESNHLTKSELREKLERQVELINRKRELENKQFI